MPRAHVQCDRPGRDDRDRLAHLIAEAHHRTFAVTLLDLGHRQFEGLLAVGGLRHGATSRCSRCSRSTGIGQLAVTLKAGSDK